MKLSEEFEEKFKGVMQHDNAIQVCESVFDWLQQKEREGEVISLEGVISVLNDRKGEIDKIWSIAQDGGQKKLLRHANKFIMLILTLSEI